MESMLLDVAGHRRSPATMPGYRRGRPPRNKASSTQPTHRQLKRSSQSCAQSVIAPTATDSARSSFYSGAPDCESAKPSHSRRAIWTDPVAPYSSGAGGAASAARFGMDRWAWEQLDPWLEIRRQLPIGAVLCVIHGPTSGRRWEASAARKQLHHAASAAGVRRRFAPHQLQHAHAVEMAHEGVPCGDPGSAWPTRQPWDHQRLPAGHR